MVGVIISCSSEAIEIEDGDICLVSSGRVASAGRAGDKGDSPDRLCAISRGDNPVPQSSTGVEVSATAMSVYIEQTTI